MTEQMSWILLVEDDPIFSLLFCRSWTAAVPAVQVSVAGSLEAMRQTLARASCAPCLVVLDQNLPDGNGHQAAPELSTRTYCWSSQGEGGIIPKPQGKPALDEAVQMLAGLAGLSPGWRRRRAVSSLAVAGAGQALRQAPGGQGCPPVGRWRQQT
jgi:hypothetical protein